MRMPTCRNLEFSCKTKRSREREKEETCSSSSMANLTTCLQTLLNKNRFVCVDRPIGMGAEVVGVREEELRSAMRVTKAGDGHVARVSNTFKPRGICLQGMQEMVVSMGSTDRLPNADLISCSPVAYRTKSAAITAFCLHILFNSRKANGASWCFKHMFRAKELVLLMPESKNLARMRAVATIFCSPSDTNPDETRVLARYLEEREMMALPPIEIATDSVGLLSGTYTW